MGMTLVISLKLKNDVKYKSNLYFVCLKYDVEVCMPCLVISADWIARC